MQIDVPRYLHGSRFSGRTTTCELLTGDALSILRQMPSESVQCVVTSPPYLGLRSYGTDPQTWGGDPEHAHEWGTVSSPGSRSSDTKPGPLQHAGNKGRERLTSDVCACGAWRGELGLEPTPALFIEHLVMIFREVKRVLRSDGLCFVNIGSSYWTRSAMRQGGNREQIKAMAGEIEMPSWSSHADQGRTRYSSGHPTLKDKDLTLVPERFAIAMQDDGWWVRSCIVWAKKSCMPESVKDRPTSAWEPIWMFAKSRQYFYDADAVRQPHARLWKSNNGGTMAHANPEAALNGRAHQGQNHRGAYPLPNPAGANLRNVWTLGPEPSREEHYASFPSEIPRRCILAGTSERGACPACGAPWVRVVERGRVVSSDSRMGACGTADQGGLGNSVSRTKTDLGSTTSYYAMGRRERIEAGWQPSCSCYDDRYRALPKARRARKQHQHDAVGSWWKRARKRPGATDWPTVSCVVLDPFGGSGTTGVVANLLGRNSILMDLKQDYIEIAKRRLVRQVRTGVRSRRVEARRREKRV